MKYACTHTHSVCYRYRSYVDGSHQLCLTSSQRDGSRTGTLIHIIAHTHVYTLTLILLPHTQDEDEKKFRKLQTGESVDSGANEAKKLTVTDDKPPQSPSPAPSPKPEKLTDQFGLPLPAQLPTSRGCSVMCNVHTCSHVLHMHTCTHSHMHTCTHSHTHTHTVSSQSLPREKAAATAASTILPYSFADSLPCLDKAKQRGAPEATDQDSKNIADNSVS